MKYCTLALILSLLAPASAALAADNPKPLRTLVYDIQYDWFTTRSERTSGFTGTGEPGPAALTSGSATAKTDMQSSDKGKLTLAVIAASAAGLVIDATFAGEKSPQAAIRVLIYPDGSLAYDKSKTLSPEALAMLPLFAGGLIAQRDVTPGSSWSVALAAPLSGTVTYKIDDLDGALAKMTIVSTMRPSGTDSALQESNATATYDVTKLDPVAYDLTVRVKREVNQDTDENSRSHLVAKLASDSFIR